MPPKTPLGAHHLASAYKMPVGLATHRVAAIWQRGRTILTLNNFVLVGDR